MKHSDVKYRTRKKLSECLKKKLEEKPISKITVSELTIECGLNRKTFYYHFKDIKSLLRWTLEQDAMNTVKEYGKISNYSDAINFALEYINTNKELLGCAYESMGNEALRYFCNEHFKVILVSALKREEKKLSLELDDSFRNFLSSFYAEALTGMIAEIFENDEEIDTDKLNEYLNLTLKVSIPAVISSAGKRAEKK